MFTPTMSMNSNFYNTAPIVETIVSSYGNASFGGTYLDPDKYYIQIKVKNKTNKDEILSLFENEVYFDEKDNAAALEEIKLLQVEKKGNIFNYYD